MENPYAPPLTSLHNQVSETEEEKIRRAYLKHEASVQSIGMLYGIGAVFLLIACIGVVIKLLQDGLSEGAIMMAPVLIGLAVLQFVLAVGLRRLRPWTKIPVGILSGIGLLAAPIGTIINAYILYLVFSAKGTMVFSERYRQIIEATPHIKYKTSIIVWIFLILLLMLIGVGVVGAIISGGHR